MYLPTRTINIHGLRVAYRQLGQLGPNVLMVHGFASSGRMWHDAMHALATDYRVWAIDLPGFGESQTPDEQWCSISNWSALVREFAHQLELVRPLVVGHSMGGMIAIDLVATAPDQVSGLVLMNPVVSGRTYLDLRLLAQSPFGPLMRQLGRWVWPIAISPKLADPFGLISRSRGFYRRNTEDWSRVKPEVAVAALQSIFHTDLSPTLTAIDVPTLVVLGDYDMTAPNAEGCMAAARIPGAQAVHMPAGHLPSDDRPEEFNAALRAFLARRDVAARTQLPRPVPAEVGP